jgi:1-aminocyclopropane-1-carboxylate deaminase
MMRLQKNKIIFWNENELVELMPIKLMSEDEFLSNVIKVPMQRLQWDLATQKGIEIIVRRDDLIEGSLSGNKFYKLFYNLQEALKQGHQQILSYGGAYSNHIHALAAAGHEYGFSTIGVIRGERPARLSATLEDAERWGMRLHFLSRERYRQSTNEVNAELQKNYGDFYSIPEGGANDLGVQGTKVLGWALAQQLKQGHTDICVACGTGSTLAGISAGLAAASVLPSVSARVVGFSVLKGAGDLGASVVERVVEQHKALGISTNNWCLLSGYHAGGYAKKLPASISQFYNAFEQEHTLLLDPVYTLKMFWGVAQLLAQHYWPSGTQLILIHTGGLQGRRGYGK